MSSNNDIITTGDVKAALDYADANGQVDIVDLGDGNSAASVPKGRVLVSIKPLMDEYLERPERKRGFARLTTLDSFCDYVNRHKASGDSVVFLDDRQSNAPALRAVFNAHQRTEFRREGDNAQLAVGTPDWQDFGAEYAFPLSEEWKAWMGMPKEFTQAQFALFLEDRITDVCEPGESVRAFAEDIGAQLASAARLMELSRGLSVNLGGKVAASVNMGTGECSLTFQEEHKDTAGAPLKVPGAFAIGVPVFRLGALYQLPVRLRYRIDSGRVLWSLAVQRADKAFELALDEAAKLVEARTERPLFRGGL